MPALFERFRPQTLDRVVAQDEAVALLRGVERTTGLAGRAYMVIGPTGSGKTTFARIIARSIASDFCVTELDGDALTDKRLRDILRGLFMYGWGNGKSGRAVIVNECHGLTAGVVRALLVALEEIPSHVAWIFTTVNLGAQKLLDGTLDGTALFHRCLPVELARRGIAQAGAERVKADMASVGLDGKPLAYYVRLFQLERNSWRGVYQRAEADALAGSEAGA